MNERDIRLLAHYTDAIRALCEAQKLSYSATVPSELASKVGEIARLMRIDLAGHVDPDVVPVALSPKEREAIRQIRKCDDRDCSKCGYDCPLRNELFVRKEKQ